MNIRSTALAAPVLLALSTPTQGCYSARTAEEEQAHIVRTMAPLKATSTKIIEGCKGVLAADDVASFDRYTYPNELESPFAFDYTSKVAGTCSRYNKEGVLNKETTNTVVTYTSPEGKRWTMILSPINSLLAFPPGDIFSHAGCERVYNNGDKEFRYSYEREGRINSKYMFLENGEPCLSTGQEIEDGLRDIRWTVSDMKKN